MDLFLFLFVCFARSIFVNMINLFESICVIIIVLTNVKLAKAVSLLGCYMHMTATENTSVFMTAS